MEGIFNETEYFVEEKNPYEYLYEKERELLREMSWDDWKTPCVNVGWHIFADNIEKKISRTKILESQKKFFSRKLRVFIWDSLDPILKDCG